ncbi:MAG: PD-(D/E)XK nuclease family protein, partial [Spirochaetaceae bacterium]|nr:PD-(D/E)XK nuclease family protein [Spirochaetaceae bacterium]
CRESNRQAHLAYQWEENKRLWYVAFTRASVKLWMPLPRGKNVCQAESLLDEMLRNENDSSLKVGKIPPHEILKPKDADDFRTSLNRRIQDLTRENPQLFSAVELNDANLQPLEAQSYPKPEAADLPDKPTAWRDPVTSSYTSLVKSTPSEEEDDRDVDAGISGIPGEETVTEAAAEKSEPLPMAADRGALFGTLVHALLEECDFSKIRNLDTPGWLADEETDKLFSSLSRRYYPSDWYNSRAGDLKTMVWNTLRAPIPELGRLCDIERGEMRAEIEFNMAVPRKAELFSGSFQAKISSGFLKGFIDLCLKSGGRWWVADWKTNVPPVVESAESYNESTMKEMMDHSHYHLQYELYLLALCRTLSGNRGEAVNWEEEIGGAVYLFVRGTRENDSRGIFVSKPTLERMLTLASAMGLEGVLK